MTHTKLARSTLTVALLLTGSRTVHAQIAFEDKYVAARLGAGDLSPLPAFGIRPVNGAPLDANLAEELTEAIQRQLDAAHETRVTVVTQLSGNKISWAFVVRNAPRAVHDAFTAQFTDQLLTCVHSLPDDANLASLNLVLLGLSVGDQEHRDNATAAAAEMVTNWNTDRCATRRNSIPFLDDQEHHTTMTAASHGMLTDEFDGLIFNGQPLLDLANTLYPLYFGLGGFWTTEMTPRLHTVFEAGVRTGLLTATEARAVDVVQRTFWDWAVLLIGTKSTVVRSFIANTAAGCARSVAELSNQFQLSRCVAGGKIQLVLLHVAGENFTTIQRVVP